MENILDDMRRDAFAKMGASKGEKKPLAEAVSVIERLAITGRKKGLPALEGERENLESEFLKLLVAMVADPASPEFVTEIATNIYWMDEPEGIQAMVDYIYLRGILMVKSGDNPRVVVEHLQSLYDPKYLGLY